MADEAHTAGRSRAGAAFAARRTELGISQREIAASKLISAPALIAFEKGRSWPRDRTRAKLEQLVQWPPGTLEKLSSATQAPAPAAKEIRRDDATEIVTGAVTMAAVPVLAAAEALPADDDPAFTQRVGAVLADLRHLEGLTARAVRSSQGSAEVIRLLREIRRCYDALMTRAAASAGATLGQRLYVARNAAAFSVAEAAGAAGVAPETVSALEAEQVISADDRGRLEALITALTG
jgi:transcriptional regulator with XRE-family HTH domain